MSSTFQNISLEPWIIFSISPRLRTLCSSFRQLLAFCMDLSKFFGLSQTNASVLYTRAILNLQPYFADAVNWHLDQDFFAHFLVFWFFVLCCALLYFFLEVILEMYLSKAGTCSINNVVLAIVTSFTTSVYCLKLRKTSWRSCWLKFKWMCSSSGSDSAEDSASIPCNYSNIFNSWYIFYVMQFYLVAFVTLVFVNLKRV